MAWLGLLFLLVTLMPVLSAVGAQRNFRRAGDPPLDPADVFRDWAKHEGEALGRAARSPRGRIAARIDPAVRGRDFSGAF
jgi:hypothetical protein